MVYDIAIVGAGPAGLSAALTARQRNKSVVVFETLIGSNVLYKSHSIENYLGLPGVSGKELMDRFTEHITVRGAHIVQDKILTIYPADKEFILSTTQEIYNANTVILTMGSQVGKTLKGEDDFLGRGVSYCATCDGLIFKGKTVAAIAEHKESEEEVLFLTDICEKVLFFPGYDGDYLEKPNLQIVREKPQAILGTDSVNGLKTDKNTHSVDGVFIFKNGVALSSLVEGLAIENNFVKVDEQMNTNIKGVYAAGDLTGRPWQINRAAGQGQIAALSAITYLTLTK